MKHRLNVARRVTIAIASLAALYLGMKTSYHLLAIFDDWVTIKEQAVIFAVVVNLLSLGVLFVIYRPMQRLLRREMNGDFWVAVKFATVFLGIVFSFGIGIGVILQTSIGLVLYMIFGR